MRVTTEPEPVAPASVHGRMVTLAAGLEGLADRRWARRIGALVSGLAICAAMPPWGWWPLGFLGVAGWAILANRPTWKGRFAVGALVGLAWFVPGTLWMVKFTPFAWPVGVSVWFPFVIGTATALCPPGRWRFIAIAAVATFTEWFRWHAPFGGVPLSMLAMTQARGPLLDVARIGGSIGVSLAVAGTGATIAAAVTGRLRASAVGAVAIAAVAVAGTVAPEGHVIADIDVAAVQGGGAQQTISERTDYSAVLGRHIARADTITGPIDLVVMPENIVNVTGNWDGSPQQRLVADLARRLHATVVVGIVEDRFDQEHFYNAAVAIEPDGRQVARYDKARRVPFGEYVPMRFLLEPVAKAQLPRRDAMVGTAPPELDTSAGRLGVVISWEVFFGRRVRDAVHHDAEIILNPTNGSSYWLTQVQSQQIASSTLRAVESGRWVVQAAPTGFSAIVDPDGNVVARSGLGESVVLRATAQRRSGRTVADVTGDLTPLTLSAAMLLAALLLTRRDRRDRTPGRTRSTGDEPPDRESSLT